MRGWGLMIARKIRFSWWDNFSDLSKIMTLVFASWAIPKFFDLYEYLVWSLSEQNRTGMEGISYFLFLCLITGTVKNSLDRARAAGIEAERSSRENSPLPKSN
jgi:hypothetical protein